MIAELLFVFLIPLVWGFYELRQLRKPTPPRAPPPPDDTNQPPSTPKHE
jgi:hypothetical protein